jgi:hypothetical protein
VLDDISSATLPRLMRRTIWSALISGTIGFLVAIYINYLAGLGEGVGIAMAIFNLRFLSRRVAQVEMGGEKTSKLVRRQLGSNTLLRLVVATVIVFGALTLSTPLGIGIVAGLVIYQIVFVANLLRVVMGQGRP